MRELTSMGHGGPKWIVLDGDIDPKWIESLNTVMDDNKVGLSADIVLCLSFCFCCENVLMLTSNNAKSTQKCVHTVCVCP